MQNLQLGELPPTDRTQPKGRRRWRRRRSQLDVWRAALRPKSSAVLTTLVALAVAGSLLAVGTVHVNALLCVAPICLVAGGLAIWFEDQPNRRVPAPALVMSGLALYSFLQSVPMPPSLLKQVSSVAAQTWLDAEHLIGLSEPRWASVSVDPGASRVEALKWLSYAAITTAAARLAREKGNERAAWIVAGSALLGGLLCVMHGLLGIEDWLGLYHPQLARPPWAPAPLLNPNNFAGYLNLGLFTALGLFFSRKPATPRWAIALGIAVLAALVVLTASRGGVLALAIGFAFAGFAFRSQQRRAARGQTYILPAWLPISVVALSAATLAIIGSTDTIWQQLLDETTGKLRILEYSLPVIRDHMWTGIGRGSFETAFAAYRQEPGHHIAQYAENFVVQWVVEWGVPAGILGMTGIAVGLGVKPLGFGRMAVPTGILVGVAVLLLQNLVDLATEVASVGIAVAVLLGTIHGGADRALDGRRGRRTPELRDAEPRLGRTRTDRRSSSTTTAAALLGVGACLTVLVGFTGKPTPISDRTNFSERLVALVGRSPAVSERAELRLRLAEAILRHPADPYLPLVGALLNGANPSLSMKWLSHAMRRDSLNARPHLLMADLLAGHGVMHQALLELKLAAEYGPELGNEVADRATRWATTFEDLLRAVPDGNKGIGLLNALAARSRGTPEFQKLHDQLLAAALLRNKLDVPTNAVLSNELLIALDARAAPCSESGRADCEARLQQHAAVVLRDSFHRQLGVTLKARLLAHEMKFDEAERWLAENCPRVDDPTSCHAERLPYALKLSDKERFNVAAATFSRVACSTSDSCAEAFSRIGSFELQRNDRNAALARYERAARESPSASRWLRVAEIALQLGKIRHAEAAITSAKRLGTADVVAPVEKLLQAEQRRRLLESLSLGAP